MPQAAVSEQFCSSSHKVFAGLSQETVETGWCASRGATGTSKYFRLGATDLETIEETKNAVVSRWDQVVSRSEDMGESCQIDRVEISAVLPVIRAPAGGADDPE